MANTPRKSDSGSSSVSEKADDARRLIELLKVDLKETILLPPQRNAALDELLVHTRDVQDAEPLFGRESVSILCGHSFDGNSLITARSALKCLANIMLLEPKTRQMFADLGYASKAAERLKNDNREDEFLATRLLFLCTYETNLSFEDLLTKQHLAEGININLARHAKQYSKSTPKSQLPPYDTLALSETLKLLFNITQFYPQHAPSFTKSLLPILKLLSSIKIPSPPLQPPITYLINALLNLDLEDKKTRTFTHNPLFPVFDTKTNADRFITILDAAVRSYKEEELERLATPLMSLIRRIYDFAPEAIRAHMRSRLLPSNEERNQPLGKADTVSAFLLRLSTSPVAPNLRETISNMLFELSGRDATNFVRNVGYGFASGFLMTHDMPVPENAMEAWSTATGEGEREVLDPGERVTNVDGVEINPVTGQRRDMENAPEVEMTEEEKEREAERLFVLFERLRATGVVNVENPVAKAAREGRFEEIE